MVKKAGHARMVGVRQRPLRRPVVGTTTTTTTNVPRRNVKKTPRPQRPPKARVRPRVQAGAPAHIGQWEAASAMLQDIPPGEVTIFDVGAHYGNVTEHMLRIWKQAHVYAFDPEPESLERLHTRFDGNDRVTIVPAALGRNEGTATFHIGGQNTEMSSLRPRPKDGRRYYRHEVRKTIKVPVTTLDAYAAGVAEIPHIHFLKVDVQGGEKDILSGAAVHLMEQRIDLVYMEILFVEMYKGAAMFHQLCTKMARFGYMLFDIYGLQRSWINRQLKYGDAMWVSPRIRESRLDTYPEDWLRKSLDRRMLPNR